jgi:putative ABC transport system ATP-binding protein
MLNAVAGVWPVDAGRILIDGSDVTGPAGIPAGRLHRPGVSGPDAGHRAHMQIEENLALAAPGRQARAAAGA